MQTQGGLVARAANRQLGKSNREVTGVLSAAQRHTHFLDPPRMATVLGDPDFAFVGSRRVSEKQDPVLAWFFSPTLFS